MLRKYKKCVEEVLSGKEKIKPGDAG